VIVEVYLLVNIHGTKTKQWVVVGAGRAFPEVIANLEVAKRMAWLLGRATSLKSDIGVKDREKAWKDAEKALVGEIKRSISVEKSKCPQGRMWTGMDDIGFTACVRCLHLREDRDRFRVAPEMGTGVPAWECGAILQEVRVARKLADR
jgi:hypothetical protein